MSDGTIRFLDNYVPALKAGDYTITATQAIAIPKAPPTVGASQVISVEAPRFSIPPADIQSRFPPANAEGAFDQNLPHIVLNERSLPWERPFSAGDQASPWMALLLLRRSDIDAPAGFEQTSPTLTVTRTVGDMLAQSRDPFWPRLSPERENPATPCQTVDVKRDRFVALAPTTAELRFLAHVRQVDTGAKTTPIAASDGWFSVVIGNRMPAADGERYVAHLVSLEGWRPYIDDPRKLDGFKTVRLVSLASWAFRCVAGRGSFSHLVRALVADAGKGAANLALRLPLPPNAAPSPTRDRLHGGYTPMPYDMRTGEQTFGWYHGPFTPQPVQPFGLGSFPTSAAATIYDSATGTFDVSYAAAWEMGRLLALSDRVYAMQQNAARQSLRKSMNLLRERASMADSLLQKSSLAADDGGYSDLLDPTLVSDSFMSWALSSLAPAAAKRAARPNRRSRSSCGKPLRCSPPLRKRRTSWATRASDRR
jgi:hypothetical protein